MEIEIEKFIKNIESNFAEITNSLDITDEQRAKLRALPIQRQEKLDQRLL